jgi:Zn-dependent M16 (insulinase) family peptidase
MKTQEDGLAYGSSVYGDPKLRALQYFAARSPDITSLLQLVDSIAQTIPNLRDPYLIDYALQETFPTPRSMLTFTERGRAIAKDIRDGNDPETVRRFSEAILKVRNEPNLLTELTSTAIESICPVIVTVECARQQRDSRSLFFFVGPERLLGDAEKKLEMPKLLRLYTADFWIDYPDRSAQTRSTAGDLENERARQPLSPN